MAHLKNMDEKPGSRNPVERCVLFAIETSFTADYLDTLSRLGVKLAAGILTNPPLWSLRGIPVVLHPEEVSALLLEIPVALCSVTPKRREEAHLRALSLGFTRFTSIIDPTAIISNRVHRGQGIFINANVALGGEVELDDFVTVNRSASVGHHTVLERFATVGPGATIASQCKIGKRVMIGAGAVISPSVVIGDGATVATGAVVFRDVDPGATILGNPARIARRGSDENADSSL
jgi:sugar O-acyltransferase (sialic acid O-acetyltransferase NeuD family)